MKVFLLTFGLFLVVTLSSCGQQKQKTVDLEPRLASLEQEVKDLKQQFELDQLFRDADKFAYLTPGGSGYSIIRSDIGVLTVSISNVQPYANGSKVTLQFGNLTSATIDGLKAKVDWGVVDDKGSPDNKTQKSKEIVFVQSLIPGAWTNADVVLDGTPPGLLGFVRLSNLGHQGVKLRK